MGTLLANMDSPPTAQARRDGSGLPRSWARIGNACLMWILARADAAATRRSSPLELSLANLPSELTAAGSVLLKYHLSPLKACAWVALARRTGSVTTRDGAFTSPFPSRP